jgi:two-component system response regulator AtoC
MCAVERLVAKIAPTAATVLIRGETGTGKEVVARRLHRMSAARDRELVKIDCTALSDTLAGSELFGYEKGAFTGAFTRKPGRVELANGSTLFLDEVAELSLPCQAKLLRLLQDREFERIGGTQTLRVDIRIIAATHRNIERMVADGTFRQDLFFRLNVIPIWLPPLRARGTDIAALARRFCDDAATRNGKSGVTIETSALDLLAQQDWPGNVRQLENFIERLVVLAERSCIERAQVQAMLQGWAASDPYSCVDASTPPADAGIGRRSPQLSETLRDAERSALTRALREVQGNRSAAARLLGLSRSHFYQKLSDHGLS